MRRQLPGNLAQGQAGVHRVASELLLRGINPTFPAVDIGGDLLIDHGVRVQVKSAHLVTRKVGKVEVTAYWFKLSTKAVVRKKTIKLVPRIFSDECEFVILWGIEQNRFWIVPSPVLDGRQLVVVDLDAGWISSDLEALRLAREDGLSYREMAKKFDLSHKTIWRRLNLSSTPKGQWGSLVQAVRETENRWDLIPSYLATLEENEHENAEAFSTVDDQPEAAVQQFGDGRD
jgi:hypothetical protein